MNMKFKRALLVLMMLTMTLSAVTGGTIAWFTDSVESNTNVIKAGNLDVELYHENSKVSEKVTADTKLFQLPTLWEPGAVAWENLTVANEGDLHMYYTMNINVTGENYVDGHGLSTALKVAMVDEISASASRDEVIAQFSAAQNADVLKSAELNGKLAPDAEKTYGMIIYWEPSDKDNQWNVNNGKTTDNGADHLEITLGVKLEATQLDVESDAFGPEYDENAKFVVNTADELQAALNKGGKVVLAKDIALETGLTVPAGVKVDLDLSGHTLTGTDASYAIRVNGEMTLSGKGEIIGEFGALNVRGTVVVNDGAYTATGVQKKTHHCVYIGTGGNLTINGGTFTHRGAGISDSGSVITVYDYDSNAETSASVTINGGNFIGGSYITCLSDYGGDHDELIVKGGTFNSKPSAQFVAKGHEVVQNANGTWTVEREYTQVAAPSTDKAENGQALADAINGTTEATFLNLGAGEYKMPSIGGDKDVTIVGTKDTVIDVTMGAYMDDSTVAFEGVTIKGSTGYANGNGSDYAALYTPNVTYTNCTFDGPFRIGRDGATFINCTFTNLGNDYVWTYGNDATFKGCTFNTDGKALLIFSDGGNEVSKVVVENCTFNATQGAKAGAIANQNCAAIEIHNYGNGVDLTTSGNSYDSDFSGEWRIKTYENGHAKVFVNGTEYTTIALDGKTMTIDANKNVTVNN